MQTRLILTVVNMLVHLYAVHAWGENSKEDAEAPRRNGYANGHANGYARVDNRVRDAHEFELEGLDSDDDEESSAKRKEQRPLVHH